MKTVDDEVIRIKKAARGWARSLDGGKIIVPRYLARVVRNIGAWDNEIMLEQMPIRVDK
jgi:hypothetical protein